MLRDDYQPGESDIDLLIDFGSMEGYQKGVNYFDVLEALQALLGVDIDLVMIGALTNPCLAREIKQLRRVLYAA